MLPDFCDSIVGITYFAHNQYPRKLTLIVRSHYSFDISCARC
jgi:hypothetical protein